MVTMPTATMSEWQTRTLDQTHPNQRSAEGIALIETMHNDTPIFNEAVINKIRKDQPRYAPDVQKELSDHLRFSLQRFRPPLMLALYLEEGYTYCEKCDYSTHFCAGCDKVVPHGIDMCYECCKALDVNFLTWTVSELGRLNIQVIAERLLNSKGNKAIAFATVEAANNS